MKLILENDREHVGIIIPDDTIKEFLNGLGQCIVIRDDMTDSVKQNIRSIRMMLKSALLVTGDSIRKALDIDEKPTKNIDTVDWYSLAIADKLAKDAENQALVFRLEGPDETPIVTQIYTKSI